jgi:hypothetical protein
MNDTIDELNFIINLYLKDVFNSMDIDTNNEDWLDDFRFKAVNDWETGYDIIEGRCSNFRELLDFPTTCEVISIIQTYYRDNYGEESLMTTHELTPEKVIRNYAYIYTYGMDDEELRELLDVRKEESEEVAQ